MEESVILEESILNFEAFYLCGCKDGLVHWYARVYSLSDALDLFGNYPEIDVFRLYGKLCNGSKVFIGQIHV